MNQNDKTNVQFASRYRDLQMLKRSWFPLWKIDGYILREFLVKYSILLLVFIILFTLNDIYCDIADFLDAKAHWREIAAYFICKMPGNIRFILPISMLLGCMWTLATFGKNLEITAMRASGVSLSRCAAMIFLMGIVVSGVNIYFNEILVPITSSRAEEIFDTGADKRRYAKSLLTYRSDDGRRRWLFQLFTASGSYENVTLKTFWSKYLMEKLIGKPGEAAYEKNLRQILGAHYAALPAAGSARDRQIEKLLLNRKLDFSIRKAFYDSEKKYWFLESGSFVSYDRNEETAFTGSSGISALHADMKIKDLILPVSEVSETPFDIANSVKEKDDLSTPVIWKILQRNPNMPERSRCIYETVFFYRIAFPWGCFIAVFLGVPLAVKNERSGSMLAIVSAIVLIVLYIIFAQALLTLGKAGMLNPAFAGLAPTIGFIAAGLWNLFRDRT